VIPDRRPQPFVLFLSRRISPSAPTREILQFRVRDVQLDSFIDDRDECGGDKQAEMRAARLRFWILRARIL